MDSSRLVWIPGPSSADTDLGATRPSMVSALAGLMRKMICFSASRSSKSRSSPSRRRDHGSNARPKQPGDQAGLADIRGVRGHRLRPGRGTGQAHGRAIRRSGRRRRGLHHRPQLLERRDCQGAVDVAAGKGGMLTRKSDQRYTGMLMEFHLVYMLILAQLTLHLMASSRKRIKITLTLDLILLVFLIIPKQLERIRNIPE